MRDVTTRRAVLVAGLLTLLGHGSGALAGEVIRYGLEPGTRYTFDATQAMDVAVSVEAGAMSTPMRQRSTRVTRGAVQVLEARDGHPVRSLITFDPVSAMTTGVSIGGAATPDQSAAFALAGRTVETRVAADGQVSLAPSAGEPALPPLTDADRDIVENIAQVDPAFLPQRPVSAGDTWEATLGTDRDATRPRYRFTVDSFGEHAGRRVAHLKTAATVETNEDGLRTTARLTGTVVLDLATGLPLSMDESGEVTTSGRADMGGVPATIAGEGTVEQNVRIRFAEDAAAPPPPEQPQPGEDGEPVDADQPDAERGPALIPGWNRYRHPLSDVSFQHPAEWKVQATAGGIVITPDDHDPNRELLFGAGTAAPGVSDASAPAVVQQLDALVRSQTPGMTRAGAPEKPEHPAGPAAKYTYRGALPDGRRAVSDVYVLVADELAVTVAILADDARLKQRSPTLRRLFGTVTTTPLPDDDAGGDAEIGDRRLIGMFRGETISSEVDGIYINTQLAYAFGADGRVLYGAKSHMAASERDYTGELVWTAHGESEGQVQPGRWQARDGFLTIRWDSGTRSVFAYGFEPDGALVFRDPQTRKLINFFPRVR